MSRQTLQLPAESTYDLGYAYCSGCCKRYPLQYADDGSLLPRQFCPDGERMRLRRRFWNHSKDPRQLSESRVRKA